MIHRKYTVLILFLAFFVLFGCNQEKNKVRMFLKQVYTVKNNHNFLSLYSLMCSEHQKLLSKICTAQNSVLKSINSIAVKQYAKKVKSKLEKAGFILSCKAPKDILKQFSSTEETIKPEKFKHLKINKITRNKNQLVVLTKQTVFNLVLEQNSLKLCFTSAEQKGLLELLNNLKKVVKSVDKKKKEIERLQKLEIK